MTTYRALLSIPVEADDDQQAIERANELATKLRINDVVLGHVEMVGEAGDGVSVRRPVYIDPRFGEQVP